MSERSEDKAAEPAQEKVWKSGSRLERLLAKGEFVVCGEMAPPQSADGSVIERKAENFKGFVDAVNLTDNATGIVRMSSIACSALAIKQGLEPIVQMTCRDRNRLALQGDVLGAFALGARNVLCLTGDHQSMGNHPQAKNVFELDSIQLVDMVRRMRDEKVFQGGDELKVEPRIFIGAAENPFADPLEFRAPRLGKKVAAGADFIQTQAVYDLERFRKWMDMVRERGLHEKVAIIAGVLPCRSARGLEYQKTSVPGMSVPDELISRMKSAEKPEDEGVRICVEIISQLREIEGVRGVHIMPVMWERILPAVVEQAGLLPRPEVGDEG
jgi:methylenetetrahydrofolate reductase (NADPH)